MKAPAALMLLLWAVLAVALWTLALVYLALNLAGGEEQNSLAERLSSSFSVVRDLQSRNAQLRALVEDERQEHALVLQVEKADKKKLLGQIKLLQEYNEKNVSYTKKHEILRRRLDNSIWELFYYLHDKLNREQITNTETLRFHTENQLFSMLGVSSQLEEVDSFHQERKATLQQITNMVQNKIHRRQNPPTCNETRVLVCNLYKNCGFGCQIHHLSYCLLVAFGEDRMMVMVKDGNRWNYSAIWSSSFIPITKCGYDESIMGNVGEYYSPGHGARVVNINVVEGLMDRPEHMPLSFPKLLADQLLKYHSNPPAFFMSQFVWYIMRNSESMNQAIDRTALSIPFGKTPIVGIQVRRTDKVGFEASFHHLEEYIEWVDAWFKVQERKYGKALNKTVYIASDDPKVLPEARQKYPTYQFFGDISISESAAKDKRQTKTSLEGVITDVRLLSRCDYLVCTFSSQVCRLSYELMQVLQNDAGNNFHSLDDLYYYGGQFDHEQIAIEDHIPEGKAEMEIKKGDTIGIAGNHWNGFSKGLNRRTNVNGLFPSYKAVEKWRIIDFPALD